MAKKKSIFTVPNIIIGLGIGVVVAMLIKGKSKSSSFSLTQSPLQVDEQGCPIDRYGPSPMEYELNYTKVLSKKVPAIFEPETVLLQRRLNTKKACLEVNGIFDDKTEEALKKLTGSNTVSLQTLTFYGF